MGSKTDEDALRAVAWLTRTSGLPASADCRAETTDVPRRYVDTVLHEIAAAQLVRNAIGPGGGDARARVPERNSSFAVVNAVAPLKRIRRCPLGLQSLSRLFPPHRTLHRAFDKACSPTEPAIVGVWIGQLVRSTSSIVPRCEVTR